MAGSYSSVLRDELNRIEYDNQILSNIGENVSRFSSGCLVNDLIMGGGVPPAMVTYLGHETGGKSTLLNHTLYSGLQSGVKNILHFDAEGTRDPEYVDHIFKDLDLSEIYGIPGSKPGEWKVEPLVNYYAYSQFERVFGVFRAFLNILPDKIYRKNDNTWYYVFSNKKEELARLRSMDLTVDKKLSDRKKYWCPTDDAGTQAILAVDSWVSLVLESQEEEENDKSGIAAEAREFPKRLRQLKGRILRKQAVLLGTNQIREAPMVRYGNPNYEPGGNALKFWSDIRNGMRPIVPKDGFIRDKEAGALSVEDSIFHGKDHYAFKSITNVKNKYGRPLLKGKIRIWVSDPKGKAHGIDPVYDIYQYLSMTGQLAGSIGRGFTVDHPHLSGIKMKWKDFKELVLYEHFNEDKKLKSWRKSRKISKKFNLRNWCEAQIHSGKALDLLYSSSAKTPDTEESDYDSS